MSRHSAAAIVAIAAVGVYSTALLNEFTYDDGVLALNNPWIRDFRFIPDIFTSSLWSFHTAVPQNFYRPLMHVIYMIDYHIFGLEPWGFHLTKVLFHAGSCVLVVYVVSVLQGRLAGGKRS